MDYSLAFGVALTIAATLTAAIDAWERRRLSRAGGPFAAADFCGLITLLAFAGALSVTPGPMRASLLGLLPAGLFVLLVGALTDQWHLARGLRFLAVVLAGFWLSRQGICIATIKLLFSTTFVSLGVLGPILSVLWLALSGSLLARVGTIPRVALGVAALASGTLYLVCLMQPTITGPSAQLMTLLLLAATLPMAVRPEYLTFGGATAGFYLLGFLLGAAAILGMLKHTALLAFLLPLMIMGTPLFAALYAWLADWIRGRRRDFWRQRHPHLHEILLAQGYTPEQVATILLAGTALLCLWALVLVLIIEWHFAWKLLLTLLVLAGALFVLYVLLRLMKPMRPPSEPPAEEVRLFGVRVHRVTMAEAMQRVEAFMRQDTPHMIVTSDAIGLMKAQDDPELRRIINEADLVTADGAGVVLSARLLNLPLDVRVAGCDMVEEICRVAARLGRSVYLLGAAPGVAEKAAENLQRRVPGLVIAGCQHGYFSPEEEPQIIAEIAQKRPGALFVALGIPRQEKWIKAHLQELGVPVCIGVGGSFDVISGLKKRAPRWMQRVGLEWLYRVAKEPRRLPRLLALPRLLWLTCAELLRPPAGQSPAEPSESTLDERSILLQAPPSAAEEREQNNTEEGKSPSHTE